MVLEGEHNIDGEVDVTIANGTASLTTIAGNLAVNGVTCDVNSASVTFTNATSQKPRIDVINTTDDADGSRVRLIKNRGAAGQDDDLISALQFQSYNDAGTPELTTFAQIFSNITDATDGQEGGSLTFQVQSHGGGNETGLVIKGGSRDDETDVDIGLGATSLTTIVGTLTMGSTATLNNTGEIQVAAQPSITTLAGLTTIGATGVNTIINSDDIQWYNAVNDGSPQLSIGSSVNERFIIQPFYDSGAQTIDFVKFNTITASGTTDKGALLFQVDSTSINTIDDDGINLYTGKGLYINSEAIISDSSGTATLSNIDALDATTTTTIKNAASRIVLTAQSVYFTGPETNQIFFGNTNYGFDSDVISSVSVTDASPASISLAGNQASQGIVVPFDIKDIEVKAYYRPAQTSGTAPFS